VSPSVVSPAAVSPFVGSQSGGKRLARGGRLLVTSLRADRWRMASVLAAALPASVPALMAALPPAAGACPGLRHAAAVVIGCLAAVAAIGDPPRGIAGPSGAWIAARMLWPAAGSVLGAACAAVVSRTIAVGPATSGVELALVLWGIAAAAVASAAGVRQGLAPADVASVAITSVFAALAAAAALPGTSPALQATVAVLVWLTAVGGIMAALRTAVAPSDIPRLLAAAAMASTLAGMVFWLFLAPERSPWYALLAAAWFVALAIPGATIGCGSRDERSRQRLVPPEWSQAWRVTGLHAAVSGWPLVVAAVLAGDTTLAADRLVIAAGLAGCAVVVAGMTVAVLSVGGSRETALALTLGLAGLLAAAAAAFPGPWAFPAGNDVEQFPTSCKTPCLPHPNAVLPPV
jgi:hypothetical protein